MNDTLHKGDFNKGEIQIISSSIEFETPYFKFQQDEVLFPNGQQGEYTRIEPIMGGVAILPIDSSGNLILVKTFRHAIRSFSIEAPRGFMKEKESPFQAAMRELIEEVNVISADFIHMGFISPENSIINSHVHLLYAHNLIFSESITDDSDSGTISEVVTFSKETFKKNVLNNEIRDSYTVNLFLKATLLGLI